MVILGTGVGGGIIINEHILPGINGAAGEIGQYLEKNQEINTILRNMENISAKDIFDAAKDGDKATLTMVDEVGCMLGKALASSACVVNPEAFVIGGGMAKAGEIVWDVIKKYYTQYAFHATYETVFKQAELSNSAGIYGGVRLVLE